MSSNEKIEADVVVVGAGGTGICAAIAAAEKGADVVVLEKLGSPGGNSIFPAGPFAVGSPVQRRHHINTNPDEWFKRAMDDSRWRLNPKIIRAWVYKTGDTIRWLEEKGVRFIGLRGRSVEAQVWHMVDGVGARHIFRVLRKICEEMSVRVLCQTPANRILTDEKGKVTGVLASTKDKQLAATAKSVIIATGGYGGNKELLREYYPAYHENIHCCGTPHMGDGLLMAMEVGAATEGLGILQLNGPRLKGDESRYPVMRFMRTKGYILINKRGERFIDEAILDFPIMGNAVDKQPEKIVYAIVDEKMKQQVVDEWLPDWKMEIPSLDVALKAFQKYMDKGYVKSSNSWKELAEWMDANPKVLKTTIDGYNSFCDKGHDDLFVKGKEHLIPLRNPPYYAFECFSGFYGTIGGIKVNEHMEVLDKQDKPIPGLYAGGVDVGGWQIETYNVALAGSTFSFALNSGRIAGENAADYISGK